jgi:branched-chain amino acid transport system permease protein
VSARNRQLALYAAVAIVMIALPWVLTSASARFLSITALLYALLAMSWNLTFGFGGIFNFAHVAFFAIGAYASGILTSRWGISPWIGLAAGCGAGIVASYLAFIPVIRFKGIYLGLVTFVFAQICFYVVLNQSGWTGGQAGIGGLTAHTLGGTDFTANGGLGYYGLAAALVFVSMVGLALLVRSTYGRALIAQRDHEDYALSRGVPVMRHRLIAFNWSAGIAGATGAVYAHYSGVVSPELFGFDYVTLVLSMILLGGMSSVIGPLFGAIIITYVDHHLRTHGAWRQIVIGSVILAVIWLLPGGIASVPDRLRTLLDRTRRRPDGAGEDVVEAGGRA